MDVGTISIVLVLGLVFLLGSKKRNVPLKLMTATTKTTIRVHSPSTNPLDTCIKNKTCFCKEP